MKQITTFLASLLFLLTPILSHAQATVSKDLSIENLSVTYSCEMHETPIDIIIKNLGSTPFSNADLSNLKLYYVVDRILGNDINIGQIVPGEDTISADLSQLAQGLASQAKITFPLCASPVSPLFDMGDFGEIHQIRAWIEWGDDAVEGNNSILFKIGNPGMNLAEKGSYDPAYFYVPGLRVRGLWTEYPAASALAGGWNALDTVQYADALGNDVIKQVISWRPSATKADSNQWLFSDCLLMNGVDKYTIGFKPLTYGDTQRIELVLATGLTPASVVKIIDTLFVYSEATQLSFPFVKDYPVLTSFTAPDSAIYHIGMRLITPFEDGQMRKKMILDGFQVTNPTPYRIAINTVEYPKSSCDMDKVSVKVGFYNEGTERYADSISVKLFYTLDGKDTLSIAKRVKLTLDAKMEITKSVFVNFDKLDVSKKGLYKFWQVAEYLDNGKSKKVDIFGSANVNNMVLNAVPTSTPYAMGFEEGEYYQDWSNLSSSSKGIWRRLVNFGGRSAEQRDSTPAVMEAYAPTTGSADVYLKSTCFQLSADSIYTLSTWAKWMGDTLSGSDGSTLRYSISKVPTATEFAKQASVIYSNAKLHGVKEWTKFSKDFTITANGVYYFGFNFKATTSTAAIQMDDVRLTARAKIAEVQNLKAIEITQNTAKITWDALTYPNPFYYRLYLNTALLVDSLTTTTYDLSGLVANTDYTLKLIAWVAGEDNVSEVSATFKTLVSEIPVPQNLAISQITDTTALFSWTDVEMDSAHSYTIYLDTTIVAKNITTTQYKFENLSPKTTYTAGLALITSLGTEDPFIQSLEFTTLVGDTTETPGDSTSIETITEFPFIKIYPNPSVNGIFSLQTEKDYQVRILDYSGREIRRQTLVQGTHALDLSEQSKGIYFLYLQNKEENRVCKIIVR